MSFFISEKDTEAYLALETRKLPMPDGTMQPLTGFKLMWRSVDYLILTAGYSRKQLVQLALINTKETGHSFEESFNNVIAYIHREIRKQQGID